MAKAAVKAVKVASKEERTEAKPAGKPAVAASRVVQKVVVAKAIKAESGIVEAYSRRSPRSNVGHVEVEAIGVPSAPAKVAPWAL